MSETSRTHEFIQLVVAAHAGDASEEQLSRLQNLLQIEPWARELYVELMDLQSQMAWTAICDSQDSSEKFLSARPSKGKITSANRLSQKESDSLPNNRLSRRNTGVTSAWWLTVASTLLLTTGGIGGWYLGRSAPNRQVAERSAPMNEPIAYLAVANGCAWGDGEAPVVRKVGTAVQSGDELTLHEGIAEFRLASGVSLSIEGPAAVVLASPSSLLLRYGKLTAHVPRADAEFRMITAACRLSARDAECGISLSGATLEVHVFSGEVRAVSSLAAADVGDLLLREGGSVVADDDGFFANAIITAGRALTLTSQSDVLKVSRWSKATPSIFASKLPMSGALPIATAYVNAVKESKPAGYWRFESLRNATAENEIPGGIPLELRGNARLSGNSQNRVVEFGHTGSYAYLIGKSPCDSLSGAGYSVEFWARPNHCHRGGMVVLMEDPEVVRGLHALLVETHGSPKNGFQSQQPKRIRFLHRDPPSAEKPTGTSCYSKKEYLVRRWQHIVATKDDGQIRLYVNGVLAGTGEDRSTLSSKLRLVVGWTGAGMDDGRYFIGRLDELAVYDRTLSANEILRHYKAVRWNAEETLDDSI